MITIYLLGSIKNAVWPSQQMVSLNSAVLIPCTTTYLTQWFHNGRILKGNDNIAIGQNYVVILSMKSENAGIYSCFHTPDSTISLLGSSMVLIKKGN